MADVINAYFHADGSLFVTSLAFYILLVGPVLCLFILHIVSAIKNKNGSYKIGK